VGQRVEAVLRREQITRLGEGVDARRRLLPLPIARVRNVLSQFRREAEAHGAERVLAVATSAVRDAENGEAFLGEVEWSYGFTARLLSGDEEALLTARGATIGRHLDEPALVVDIGGGSTELVDARASGYRTSLELGCVRLTERFLESDPPARAELDACSRAVRRSLDGAFRPLTAIGVAGTITTLAALDLGLQAHDPHLVDGHRLSADAVSAQLERLAALPLEARRAVPALEPQRAPVIVAGAMILHEVMAHFGLAEIEASERDLLDGAALEAAVLPAPVEGDAPPGAYTCC
jgi:exopolyphosphatase / guanosine-5'-triphosphate,3'-diphosphate pyrophosphatase